MKHVKPTAVNRYKMRYLKLQCFNRFLGYHINVNLKQLSKNYNIKLYMKFFYAIVDFVKYS